MLRTSTNGLKNEQVYKMLKKDILSLAIRPGEKISEAILSEQYGVSRSPIRDALRRLLQDGLIAVQPQVGTFIADISPSELFEILQIKIANDPLAAKLAAGRVTPDSLKPVRKKLEQIKTLEIDKRYQQQKEFDDQLHILIFDNCGAYLGKLCRDLFHYSERIRLYTTKHVQIRRRDSLKEAERVLAALENKDPQEAFDAMKEHLENVYATFANTLTETRVTANG